MSADIKAITPNYPELPLLADARLDERQLAAIRMMVLGRSLVSIVQTLGIARKTLYNWRQSTIFRRELNRLRRQLWTEAADRLRAMVHPSLDVLEQHLRQRHPHTKYRAANAVLRHANLKKCVPLQPSDDDCEADEDDYD